MPYYTNFIGEEVVELQLPFVSPLVHVSICLDLPGLHWHVTDVVTFDDMS